MKVKGIKIIYSAFSDNKRITTKIKTQKYKDKNYLQLFENWTAYFLKENTGFSFGIAGCHHHPLNLVVCPST